MFNTYNEKSCLFECRLKFAIKAGNCIPLDYPAPAGHQWESYPICVASIDKKSRAGELSSLEKFERAMDSADSMKHCECLPNCEEVTYESKVSC